MVDCVYSWRARLGDFLSHPVGGFLPPAVSFHQANFPASEVASSVTVNGTFIAQHIAGGLPEVRINETDGPSISHYSFFTADRDSWL
jgi:hypothetical protein